MTIEDAEFEKFVSEAIDSLPEQTAHTNNVAFVIEDEPSFEQRQKLNLMPGHSLFGLYEGIPLTKRLNNYSLVLPDKITIFKNPLVSYTSNIAELKEQIKRTVWHEIAHHYGLDHDQIYNLQKRSKRKKPDNH